MDRKPIGNILGMPDGSSIDRRGFLAGLAALGGGVALASAAANPEMLVPKGATANPETPTTAPADAPSRKDVGKVTNIKSEMKEYKDPKTGCDSSAHQQRLQQQSPVFHLRRIHVGGFGASGFHL